MTITLKERQRLDETVFMAVQDGCKFQREILKQVRLYLEDPAIPYVEVADSLQRLRRQSRIVFNQMRGWTVPTNRSEPNRSEP